MASGSQWSRFGSSGLRVPRLAIGTMTFGVQCDERTSHAILDQAADAGMSLIDTADIYPIGGSLETVGRTEEIIGRWLKGRRARSLLATKCRGATGPNPWERGSSRKHVLDAIEASLCRLQTDYVDLYQLHWPDGETPIDETLEALDLVVRSGKARYIGCSNFMAYQVARALGRSEARGFVRFASVQPRYNLLFREVERELMPLCAEEGLAVLVYNPIAGGLLSGKHDRARPPASGRFALEMYQQRYWHDREFDTVDCLRPLAAESGMPLATMAVAWVLANPAVTTAIVGVSRPEQLADSLAALERPLLPALKARLDALTVHFRSGEAGR